MYICRKRKGMSEAKWVWTEVAYFCVNGANYKLKFDRITRKTEVFKGFFFLGVLWADMLRLL